MKILDYLLNFAKSTVSQIQFFDYLSVSHLFYRFLCGSYPDLIEDTCICKASIHGKLCWNNFFAKGKWYSLLNLISEFWHRVRDIREKRTFSAHDPVPHVRSPLAPTVCCRLSTHGMKNIQSGVNTIKKFNLLKTNYSSVSSWCVIVI